MTKIPLKVIITKIPLNVKDDRNTFEIYKMTKIPSKPKNDQNTS